MSINSQHSFHYLPLCAASKSQSKSKTCHNYLTMMTMMTIMTMITVITMISSDGSDVNNDNADDDFFIVTG